MLVAQEVEEGDADENVKNVNVGDDAEGDVNAANDEVLTADEGPSVPSPTPPTLPLQPYKVTQAIEITKLKQRVKKLERRNKVKVLKLRRLQKVGSGQRVKTSDDTVIDDVSKQGRMIAEMDQDVDGRQVESQAEINKIDLDHANKVLRMQEEESKPAELQEVVDIVTTAKLIIEVVTATSITITAADVPVPAATTAVASKLIGAPSRRTNGVVIRDFEESSTTTTSIIIHTEAKSKDNGKGILSTKTISETPAEKAAKRKKLDEEIEELKIHLQIVPNKDNDVYTEATLLPQKVPVVDYEIIDQNNKPYYKIIRADDHYIYNHTADFVSREEVPTHNVHSGLDAK
nr:hypothetical protein [Tanacetum cinerariifolium]